MAGTEPERSVPLSAGGAAWTCRLPLQPGVRESVMAPFPCHGVSRHRGMALHLHTLDGPCGS